MTSFTWKHFLKALVWGSFWHYNSKCNLKKSKLKRIAIVDWTFPRNNTDLFIFFLKPGLKIREENISPLDTMNWTSHCKNLLSITKGEFYFGPLLYLFSVHVWHGRKVVRRKNQELWSSRCRPGSVIPILWGSRTDTLRASTDTQPQAPGNTAG